MSTYDAYQALVIDQGTVVYCYTTWLSSQAWSALSEYASICADGDTARTLEFERDQGKQTVRLVRRFNGKALTYQVRTVSVDAKGNLVDVAL